MRSFWKDRPGRVFLCTLLFGILTHAFRLTNKFLCLDSYNYLHTISASWTVSLGRFFLHYVELFRGPKEITWLIGLLSIAYIAVCAALIAGLFDIKSRISQLLIGAVLVCNPVVTSTFAYMYTADGYFLGLVAAVLAAYFVGRVPGIKGVLLGGACFLFSLGMYQAYMSVTVLLLLFLLMKLLLDPQKEMKAFWKEAGRYLLMGVLAMAVYLPLVPAFRKLYGVDDTAAGMIGGAAEGGSRPGLTAALRESFIEFARFLLVRWKAGFYNISNVLVLLSAGVLLIWICARRGLFKKPLRILILAIFLLILPVLTHPFMFVTARNIYLSTPASYSMCLLWILPLLLWEWTGCAGEGIAEWKSISYIKKHFAWVVQCVLMFMIVAHFVVIAGRAYESMILANDRMENFLLRLQTRLELQEEYDPETKLAVIGNVFQLPEYVPDAPMMSGVVSNLFMEGQADYIQGLNWYMSTSYGRASEKRRAELVQSEDFADMHPWPAEDSIRMIDGVMVVYLSDTGVEELKNIQ